jgi:hypothetical protein
MMGVHIIMKKYLCTCKIIAEADSPAEAVRMAVGAFSATSADWAVEEAISSRWHVAVDGGEVTVEEM